MVRGDARSDGYKGLRLGGLGEGGNGDWGSREGAKGRRWVVVALADGAGCGMVPAIDPMSAKRREFPRAGTVISVPVGKQSRAYIVSLDGSSSFWLCDFLTTERVFDRSLFDFGRWAKRAILDTLREALETYVVHGLN